uniref:C2 tensin-type domain-containing protein n=1 Tax=Cyprinus carpio TaxID=7962 RepID=A0A8C2GE65_CYPCA
KICAVCKTMENWLNSDPQNVVVLYFISNSYDYLALLTVAMRKFCDDKISSSLQPSQNRYDQTLFLFYIYYFAGLLSGSKKMNSSPLFLHKIHIPALLNYQAGGGYSPFLKLYQSLQLVYSSVVSKRECVFSVQFHTCSVHGSQLDFGKGELDHACMVKPTSTHLSNPGVSVDYGSSDPIVRWDSYENFNIHQEDSVEGMCSQSRI